MPIAPKKGMVIYMNKIAYIIAVIIMTVLVILSAAACNGKNESISPDLETMVSETTVPDTTLPEEMFRPSDTDEPATAPAWWSGDWHGYWTVTGGQGIYENLIDNEWDCYAIINTDADNTTTILIWDDEVFRGEVEIKISNNTSEEQGVTTSVSGVLFDDPVTDVTWIISPGSNDDTDTIIINGKHDYPNGDWFRYDIYLNRG